MIYHIDNNNISVNDELDPSYLIINNIQYEIDQSLSNISSLIDIKEIIKDVEVEITSNNILHVIKHIDDYKMIFKYNLGIIVLNDEYFLYYVKHIFIDRSDWIFYMCDGIDSLIECLEKTYYVLNN